MLEKEPDFKIIANFLLHRIEPLKTIHHARESVREHEGCQIERRGHQGNAAPFERRPSHLACFPAGEVSTYQDGKLVVDKDWEEGAIKVIRKAQVSRNSRFISMPRIAGCFISFLN